MNNEFKYWFCRFSKKINLVKSKTLETKFRVCDSKNHLNKMTKDEEDVPQLSAETLKILQEFLQEQAQQQEGDTITENWQLSQFWYDEHTTSVLSTAALNLCENGFTIALLSCPTLYPTIKSKITETNRLVQVKLFEYDKRFSKYDPDFIFYDYNEPVNVTGSYKNCFDVIVVDPPFLSEECLVKMAETIKFIKKETSKVILCTGAVMEELAERLLNVRKCSFEPKHRNNLGNEFICMTNFGDILDIS